MIGDVFCKFVMVGILGWVVFLIFSFFFVVIVFECYFVMLYLFKFLSCRWFWFLVFFVLFLGILLIVFFMIILYYDEDVGKCMDKWLIYFFYRVYSVLWLFCNFMLFICMMGYFYLWIIWYLCNNVFVLGCFYV